MEAENHNKTHLELSLNKGIFSRTKTNMLLESYSGWIKEITLTPAHFSHLVSPKEGKTRVNMSQGFNGIGGEFCRKEGKLGSEAVLFFFSFCHFLGHSCGIWRFPG